MGATRKISTTVYLTPEQVARLKRLNEATKVPVAEYVRQGIELVLEKYEPTVRPGELPAFDWVRREVVS